MKPQLTTTVLIKKLKVQLPIETLTKILKSIYIFMIWLLRGTKDINLNISFIKLLDLIFFIYINGSF